MLVHDILLLLRLVLLLIILHLWLVLLMTGLMQLMLQVLLQLLGSILHLQLLWLPMHLHLKLLTKGLKLLHVVMVDGDRLMRHWLLCHLVERLADMVMMIHGMLVHLHSQSSVISTI